MKKIAAALVLSGGLLLVGQAEGMVPRQGAEPRAIAPAAAGPGIAKKAKGAKKADDKKADKASGASDEAGGKQKPFPSKAESLKDIDDISKK